MALPSERWNDLPQGLLPDRFSFVPGTDRKTFDFMWREMFEQDVRQVQRIAASDGVRLSAAALKRYTHSMGWTARLVLRNKASILALYLCEHLLTNQYNDVKFLWVHPDYVDTTVPAHLTRLARLELPELPTRVSVSSSATSLHKRLRDAGWTDLDDRDNDAPSASDRTRFYIRSAGGPEYRQALDSGRAVR